MANNVYKLNDMYYPNKPPAFFQNAGTEYPSHQITVRIRLNPSITNVLFNQISRELSDQNMTCLLQGNIITISGFPPDNNFNQNSVLAIVQQHNRRAQFAN